MTDPSRPGSGESPASAGGGTSLDEASGDGLELQVTSPTEHEVVVEVTGELDMLTAPHLRRVVLERIVPEATVVLALDGVGFLGTSGLAALIELREQAQRIGTTLRLACTERRVLRPLGIAGLHHLFEIRDTTADALSM